MSRYTTEVRFICESSANLKESGGFNSIDEVLNTACPIIFNFDFPIFDEEYRLPLEKKILRHFYTREIGAETVGLWKLWLNNRMNEIMPYYNKLYLSELYKFNPLYDIDLTTNSTKVGERVDEFNQSDNSSRDNEQLKTGKFDNQGTYDSTTNSSGNNVANDKINGNKWDVYSDTPQGALNNVDNNTYLTNARKVTDTQNNENRNQYTGSEHTAGSYHNSGTTHDTNTTAENSEYTSLQTRGTENTETYVQTIVGKSSGASYSARIKEFRETFLNIDLMIIRDLEDLFFGLWE